MNRRNFIQTSVLATAAIFTASQVFGAAGDGKVGKMSPDELEKVTREGGAKVKALEASSAPLSEDDQKLMMQVAMGGMMQLQLSELAVRKATSPDVKAYAQAEVEEQTVLAAKLKEVAKAKGITLPDALDEKTQKELAKLEGKSGAEFDKAYLKEGGVDGHKLLQSTMTKVESKAKDPTLKALAATTLPLIKTHLQVAQDEIGS